MSGALRRPPPAPVLSTQSAREVPLPEGFGVRLDPEARCSADGRTLLGGSPMRLLRLSEHAANLLAGLRAGAPAESRAARRLARRLCETGLAHPVPPPGGPGVGEVTCVVPVRDDPEGLATLLDSLDRHPPGPSRVVVAEDGSRDPEAAATVARDRSVRLIQRPAPRGPAAARNEGWRAAGTEIVAFLDADVEVGPGWLEPLLAHFADPTIAAVAPRVRAPAVQTEQTGQTRARLARAASDANAPAGPDSTLDRFERECSPLDMRALPSIVGPRRRVRYVPSAALLLRRDVLESLGGFDEDLRFGEDVDLVWRTVAAGWTVRYEPSVVVHHRNRPTWAALARQRYAYGTSATPLAARHPQAIAPLEIAPWSLAAWLAPALGGRRGALVAVAIAATAAGRVQARIGCRGEVTLGEAARLTLRSHLAAGQRAAVALRRAWLPLLLAAGTSWPWSRRLAVAALVVEPLASWATRRPNLGPLRWTAARLASDAAYCTGVWRGAAAGRSAAALRPRLTEPTDSGPRRNDTRGAREGAPGAGRRSDFARRSRRRPPPPPTGQSTREGGDAGGAVGGHSEAAGAPPAPPPGPPRTDGFRPSATWQE